MQNHAPYVIWRSCHRHFETACVNVSLFCFESDSLLRSYRACVNCCNYIIIIFVFNINEFVTASGILLRLVVWDSTEVNEICFSDLDKELQMWFVLIIVSYQSRNIIFPCSVTACEKLTIFSNENYHQFSLITIIYIAFPIICFWLKDCFPAKKIQIWQGHQSCVLHRFRYWLFHSPSLLTSRNLRADLQVPLLFH